MLVGPYDDLVEVAARLHGQSLGGKQLALCAGNSGEDRTGGDLLGVYVQLAHRALHEGHLVRIVVYHEAGIETDMLAFPAEHVGAEGVEGADGQVFHCRTDHRRQALAHLPRGLVGECDSGDPVGRHAYDSNEICDAMGNYPGLAAAGARDNKQGPFDGLNGFALLGIQSFKEIYRHLCLGEIIASRRRPEADNSTLTNPWSTTNKLKLRRELVIGEGVSTMQKGKGKMISDYEKRVGLRDDSLLPGNGLPEELGHAEHALLSHAVVEP